MGITLQDYYNRFSKDKNWKRILTLAGRGIQSAEFNEWQEMAALELRRLGDAIFADGTIVSGCECIVTPETGIATLGAGRIYARGNVWPVDSAEIQPPKSGTVEIGIRLRERVVTELEDGTLRDPAVGCPNYMQPGAGRLTAWAEWGLDGDISPTEYFYPIYTVTDCTLVIKNKPDKDTMVNEFLDALARYDRDAHGHYVVRGMNVSAVESAGGEQRFYVSEGLAHVRGYEVELPYSVPIVVDEAPEMEYVENEPHAFIPDSEGTMRIHLRHSPLEVVHEIGVRREKTVTVSHGSYSGCSDPLPDTSIVALISVTQGDVTYVQGDDYVLHADKIDWSPIGAEPAPGSTYAVKYQYRTTVAPANQDLSGFDVTGAVPGSEVFVKYTYRMLRRDRIVVDTEGVIKQVRGVSHRFAPAYPEEPAGTLTLALVDQNWNGLPVVIPFSVRAVPMSDLRAMQKNIGKLFDLVAIERLRTDALLSEPSAVHGVFVDPFVDDDLRDGGIEQTAAIVDGNLMLPIDAHISQFGVGHETLNYSHEVLVRQEAKTGSMQINPYQAFDPLPATVEIVPSVDRWNTVQSSWASGITRNFVSGSGNRIRTSQSTATEVVSSDVAEATTMRSREVTLSAAGFGPNEAYSVLFGGQEVASGSADETGQVNCSFSIPAGIPTGVALVRVVGAAGSSGETTYTGVGSITTQILRTVTTVSSQRYWCDPLAQTFKIPEARHISGVELWFTRAGASPVRVEIREVENGFPTSVTVTGGSVAPEAIVAGAPTRVEFPPVYLQPNRTYALTVLTDTPDHELALAELGGWDDRIGWVRAQPYGGVLLSSANAETWSVHQSADLWFRLLGAKFDPMRKVLLGSITLAGVTDLVPLAEIDTPAVGADVTFLLTNKDNGSTLRVQPNQVLNLAESLEGQYSLEAELSGSEVASPTLFGDVQLLTGALASTGDYVSRAFPCGSAKVVTIRIEAYLPGASAMGISVQTGVDTWTPATLDVSEPIGDGWKRYKYKCACSSGEARVKIALAGAPAERPRARQLRAVVTDA